MNASMRQMLQGFFRLGIFVGACGLIMVFIQPRDSAEYVVSICSALVGGVLVLGTVIVARVMR